MPLGRAGRMHVARRIEIMTQCIYRAVDVAVGECGFRLSRGHWRGSDTEVWEPYVAKSLSVRLGGCRKAEHRGIAVPPREFVESDARVAACRRNSDRSQHIAWPERGFKEIFEESVGLHRAPAPCAGDLDFAAERDQN